MISHYMLLKQWDWKINKNAGDVFSSFHGVLPDN